MNKKIDINKFKKELTKIADEYFEEERIRKIKIQEAQKLIEYKAITGEIKSNPVTLRINPIIREALKNIRLLKYPSKNEHKFILEILSDFIKNFKN